MKRSIFVRWMFAACAASVTATSAFAQQFPSHPIKILVGFGPGGGADMVARLYATKLQELLGVPVVVENKVGAGQLLALQPVKSAAPDGHTLVFATSSALVQGPGVRKDLNYDPIKDFTPIGFVARAAGMFYVNSKLPVRTMSELIAYARANPGKINYASAGVGAANHLQVEYLMSTTGIKMTHIPYKSDGEVVQQVASGMDVHLAMSVPQLPAQLATTGKVRMLAVTGARRLASVPGVPTLAESGVDSLKGIDYYSFYGLLGPAGMPADVVAKLNEALNKVSQMPDMVERLRTGLFIEPEPGTPAEFRQYLISELAKWREVGKTVKID